MQQIPNLDEGELTQKFSHHFDFVSVLGNGSFGLVVAATDKKTRELLAVKVKPLLFFYIRSTLGALLSISS